MKPKRWPTLLTAGVTALALVALVFVLTSSSSQATTQALVVPSVDVARRVFSPLPARNQHGQELVDLGRLLFHDPRLSGPNTISCATCHPMSNAGTTPEAQTMLGATGARAKWNTPTKLLRFTFLSICWRDQANLFRWRLCAQKLFWAIQP